MGYENVLKMAAIPSISLTVLSFLSIVLTTHYWILGDWIMGRWAALPSEFPEKAKFPIDDVIIDYIDSNTQATIISGCLNLAAGVMAMTSWKKLKTREMDTDFHLPLRRFYVAAVFVTGIGGACSAIASLATHFTDKGDDKFGCTRTTGKTVGLGVPFTNLMCTREMGACNVVKPHSKGMKNEWAGSIACNETMVVKWLQIILALNAVIVMGMFALQARQRRTTRWSREVK